MTIQNPSYTPSSHPEESVHPSPPPGNSIKHDQNKNEKPGGDWGGWKIFQTIISIAILSATLFTMWTPANLFSNDLLDRMLLSIQNQKTLSVEPDENKPTPTMPQRLPIGIVAGHWQNDAGAVCPDGLTEMDVNLQIATLVKNNLVGEGYDVELLSEFDKRLYQFQALVLVSIHNDTCNYIDNNATGFKVASAMSTIHPEKADRLTACLVHRYQSITGLPYHYNTITPDMTSYHAFEEINEKTPAAIIETGFLNLDRDILTNHSDVVAQGITAGILCYLRNESIPVQQMMPTP